MNDQHRGGSVLSVALQVLGALAGLATLVTLVGGTILWIRVDALRLPADQAVAVLPERLLVIVGVHALVAPVLIGLVVATTILLMNPLHGDDQGCKQHRPRKRLWVVWGLILLGGAIALYVGVEGLDLKYQLPMYGIGILGLVLLVSSALARQTRGRHIALITFAAFALCGSALAVIRTAGRPMMEPTAVLLKDARGLSGFHVASTTDHIYVASLGGEGDPTDAFADATIDRVIEIPRDEVVRRAVRQPTKIGANSGGRDEAQTLLLDLRSRYMPRTIPAPLSTTDPVADLAPLVHLHTDERYWPMSAAQFLRNSTLYWNHSKRCPEWRAVDDKHVRTVSANPERVAPTVDPERLGETAQREKQDVVPYTHAPSGVSCRDNERPVVRTTDISRPFLSGARMAGLPAAEGFFLDAASSVFKGMRRLRKNGSQVFYSGVPVYFEQNPEDKGRKRITYWLFYGYSLPSGPEPLLKNFAHEGDWERMSVLVTRVQNEKTAKPKWKPVSARYHFHGEDRDVPWADVRLAADEAQVEDGRPATHPVAYVARNSHATYPRPGRYEQHKRLGNRTVSAPDEAIACADCPQWRSWKMLRNAKRQYWYGFGGAWGVVGPDGARTGPLGPSQRKSLLAPEPSLNEDNRRRNLAGE